jgi:hypothetical protein
MTSTTKCENKLKSFDNTPKKPKEFMFEGRGFFLSKKRNMHILAKPSNKQNRQDTPTIISFSSDLS